MASFVEAEEERSLQCSKRYDTGIFNKVQTTSCSEVVSVRRIGNISWLVIDHNIDAVQE